VEDRLKYTDYETKHLTHDTCFHPADWLWTLKPVPVWYGKERKKRKFRLFSSRPSLSRSFFLRVFALFFKLCDRESKKKHGRPPLQLKASKMIRQKLSDARNP
jgi:hypothetical protein